MTKADAYSEYHRQIAANPNREYAVIRDGLEEFGVVIGEETSVRVPATLEGNWAIDSHYHPTFDWLDTRFRVIRESNFIARIPSKEDLLGVQAESTMQGKVDRMERLHWRDPIHTDRHYETVFGYKPDVDRPFWVQYPNQEGGMSQTLQFQKIQEYETWFNSLTPAGPKTPGNP